MSKNKSIIKENGPEIAFELFDKIRKAKQEAGMQFLVIGQALMRIQDGGLYKFFDCATFEEFIGLPELGFKRSMAYLFIQIYQKLILQLKMDTDRVANIDISKLQLIMPVLDEDPEEWVASAECLSKSDLGDAVRERTGKAPFQKRNEVKEEKFTGENYIEFIKTYSCIICGHKQTEPHHFPRTKGRGTEDWKAIPLCRTCHSEAQEGGSEWLWKWRVKVFDFFYNIISQAIEVVLQRQENK